MAEHVTELRVRYADTDKAGVVYNANYLVFFEVGRTEMMRALGCAYSELEERGFVMPVVETWIRFRAPARYDDRLRIESEITDLRRVRLRIDTRVRRADTGALLAEGWVWLACTGRDGRPTAIPDDARGAMAAGISCKDGPEGSSEGERAAGGPPIDGLKGTSR